MKRRLQGEPEVIYKNLNKLMMTPNKMKQLIQTILSQKNLQTYRLLSKMTPQKLTKFLGKEFLIK